MSRYAVRSRLWPACNRPSARRTRQVCSAPRRQRSPSGRTRSGPSARPGPAAARVPEPATRPVVSPTANPSATAPTRSAAATALRRRPAGGPGGSGCSPGQEREAGPVSATGWAVPVLCPSAARCSVATSCRASSRVGSTPQASASPITAARGTGARPLRYRSHDDLLYPVRAPSAERLSPLWSFSRRSCTTSCRSRRSRPAGSSAQRAMCAAPVTRSARHHPSPAVALRPKHGGPTGPSMRDTARNHPIRRPLPGVAPECAGRVRWPARREQRACGSRLGSRAAGCLGTGC